MCIEDKMLEEAQTEAIEESMLNDTYNAKIFSEDNHNTIKFCNELGGWFIHNGEYWERDDGGKILSAANQTYNKLLNMSTNSMSESLKKRWLSHVKQSGNECKIKSLINLSKMDLTINGKSFDTNNYLICLKNGIFDLKEFKLFPFNPKHMTTMQARFKYNKEADCPNWKRFLEVIFINDTEMIDYIQKILGYCLTGDISKQLFFIMKGGGRNGKSTLLSTLLYALGSYATTLDSEGIVTKKFDDGVRNDLAGLNKKRFIQISELDSSKQLHISVVKKCTTISPMKVRFLYKELFEMMPTFKMFLETNPLPTIKGEDDGTWRRLRRVDFDYQFEENATIQDYQHKYLNPEIDGIFNWLLVGLRKLYEEGECMPNKVLMSNKDYRDEENPITDFIDECCVVAPDIYTLCSDFNNYYKDICDQTKQKYILGKKHIASSLEGHGIKKMRVTVRNEEGNHGKFAYFGIKCIKDILGQKDWESSINAPHGYNINGD